MNTSPGVESSYAWRRLAAALAIISIGSAGFYSMSVELPRLQADFGLMRGDASLPYTVFMIGFGFGCVAMGWFSDRFGVMATVFAGALGLGFGYIAAGLAGNLWQFSIAHGVLIGLVGSAATFAPLIADVSLWFDRRRGIAVAILMSGVFVAGIWPPVMQYFFDIIGWRNTLIGFGTFCLLALPPLALVLRARPPALAVAAPGAPVAPAGEPPCVRELGIAPLALLAMLCAAIVGCCVAMSMPLVHLVSYCGDLGYSLKSGADMMAVMMVFGVVSRIAFGWISDVIGGVRTLLVSSLLQALALALFLPYQGLVAMFVLSAFFGFSQGGLVPSYALIVRRYFHPSEVGARIGIVMMASSFGMALGGWMPGFIFDKTGSYSVAFVNGIAWDAIAIAVALFLLYRARRGSAAQLRLAA